jgi:gamma-glutamyl hydrolase
MNVLVIFTYASIANSALVAFYDVLSVNDDLSQKVFISSFEGKKYPVYGIQWHPEKNNLCAT